MLEYEGMKCGVESGVGGGRLGRILKFFYGLSFKVGILNLRYMNLWV